MATETAARTGQTDETNRLISSQKVDGTAVYNRSGDRLGDVDHMMIDKFTGQVEYAVLSCGGFLGMGEEYSPLPWKSLTYMTRTWAATCLMPTGRNWEARLVSRRAHTRTGRIAAILSA